MTIKYTHHVAEASLFGFIKLLFRWKGSIWKMVWKDMVMFITIYSCTCYSYLFLFNTKQKKTFQVIAQYCNLNSFKIPLDFLVGFYVSQLITRFWMYFDTIPWPSTMGLYTNILIVGKDDTTRKIRRTIMRYLVCSFTLTMRSICQPVKKRFPTFKHLIKAGLLTEEEERILATYTFNFFVPTIWAQNLINHATKTGRVRSHIDNKVLIDKVNDFRQGCGKLRKYDWVNLPLVYTQVVSMAVYLFCFTCILGRYPFVERGVQESYIPFFTFLQFTFYISWFKVGQSMSNPYGEDDDDFDVNFLIDCFINEAFTVVDRLKTNIPVPTKDRHWDTLHFNMPHSPLGDQRVYIGSTGGLEVEEELQNIVEFEKVEHSDIKEKSASSKTIS